MIEEKCYDCDATENLISWEPIPFHGGYALCKRCCLKRWKAQIKKLKKDIKEMEKELKKYAK